jgi:hypothetical protein
MTTNQNQENDEFDLSPSESIYALRITDSVRCRGVLRWRAT